MKVNKLGLAEGDVYGGFPSVQIEQSALYANYLAKYRSLFLASFRVESPGLDHRATEYFLNRIYDGMPIACYRIPKTDLLAFAPYEVQEFDRYSYPSRVRLINERNVPSYLVPKKTLSVDVPDGAVLGRANVSRLVVPAKLVADYAGRMADVDMVIKTNLSLHKMPWLLTCTPDNVQRMKKLIGEVLSNKPAVFIGTKDAGGIMSVSTDTPYIIDKLTQYKSCLDSELKTLLGVDNLNVDTKSQYVNDSETNSNNEEISLSKKGYADYLKQFAGTVTSTLGISLTIEPVTSMDQPLGDDGKENDNDGKDTDASDVR